MSLDRIRAHRAGRYLFGVAASVSTVAVLIPLRFLIEPLPAPPFLLTVIAVAWFGERGTGGLLLCSSVDSLQSLFWVESAPLPYYTVPRGVKVRAGQTMAGGKS